MTKYHKLVIIAGSLESAYWFLRGGALNLVSQEVLRAPKAFGSFMIIRSTLECSYWWEIVYMRMLSGRHL